MLLKVQGNRTLANRDGTVHTYLYDDGNRIFEECFTVPGGQGTPLAGMPFVDSTKPGAYDKAHLVDGDTTDTPSAPKSWRSEDTGTFATAQHFAGLEFAQPGSVGRVKMFPPTRGGPNVATGLDRFKVQFWTGSAFADVAVTALVGAEPNPQAPGWFRTITPHPHEVTIDFTAVVTTMIRVLQDAASAQQPQVGTGGGSFHERGSKAG